MPLFINGLIVLRIGEALEQAEVSRATYFRWVKCGRIQDVKYRDRNGRRVFTPSEVTALVHAAKQLVAANPVLRSQLGLELAS
jgi:predicted site-specific integrase-resolvase